MLVFNPNLDFHPDAYSTQHSTAKSRQSFLAHTEPDPNLTFVLRSEAAEAVEETQAVEEAVHGEREAIDGGAQPSEITARWDPSLRRFRRLRQAYLLYR